MLTGKNIMTYRKFMITLKKGHEGMNKDYLELCPEDLCVGIEECNSREKKLSEEIQNQSDWDFIGNWFLYRTNFRYDEKKQDIVFDLFIVSRSKDGYKSIHNNYFENEFIEKHQKQLFDLAYYQTCMYGIYKENEESIQQNILDKNWKSSTQYVSDSVFQGIQKYIEKRGELFLKKYSKQGIDTLVNTLNLLSYSDNKIETYKEIRKLFKDSEFEEELLYWLTVYLNGGEKILAYVHRTTTEKLNDFLSEIIHKKRPLPNLKDFTESFQKKLRSFRG